MKKLLFCVLALNFLVACSKDEESSSLIDNQSANEQKTEVFIRTTDRKIVNELPTEVFEKIISDLKKQNKMEQISVLNFKYKKENGLTKLTTLPIDYSIENPMAKSLSTSSSVVTFQYRGHIASYNYTNSYGTTSNEPGGWKQWVNLGYEVGTTGLSVRLEALQFTSSYYISDFKARAYVQNLGWLAYVGLNDTIGTTGKSLQAEAFQIFVPSTFATNVYYQVHVQNIGWMPLVNNGEIAGTMEQSLRVEAFRMYMYIII